MNTIAFFTACLSGLSFIVAAVTAGTAPVDPAPRWRGINWIAVGLALYVLAWVLSVVLIGGGQTTIGST